MNEVVFENFADSEAEDRSPWSSVCSIGSNSFFPDEASFPYTEGISALAVGDMDGVPYIKMCENMPYSSLNGEELEYVIGQVAPMADRIEQALEPDGDIA